MHVVKNAQIIFKWLFSKSLASSLKKIHIAAKNTEELYSRLQYI